MRMRRTPQLLSVLAWLVALAAIALSANTDESRAQGVFERLVMPGPLAKPHEHLTKKCEACHAAFDRKSQVKLCVACHKPIAADRAAKTGFHGRSPDASTGECRLCHGDHQGRDVDVTGLDQLLFDHTMTDFKLVGKHAATDCAACHEPGKKHRTAPHACSACHKKDEPHKGRLGSNCATCHTQNAWLPTRKFDHGKTRFPLKHGHAKVACALCHAGERYKNLPTTCVSCHAITDAHQGRYGAKCETCHSETAWKTIHFRHDVATRFALKGAHAKVKCTGCHKTDLYASKPSMGCVSCHRKDDPHKGQLGNQCGRCHNEQRWRTNVAFDHDLTRFPLVGRHAKTKCTSCHKSKAFKDAPRTCSGCHSDKFHQGRLGTGCTNCHSPAGWRIVRFDHDRQTTFPLTGAHKQLNCHACHKATQARTIALPKACVSCHTKDDVHRGALGQACETCHGTGSFRLRVRRR